MTEFHFNGKIVALTFGSSPLAQSLILDLICKGAQVYTLVPFPLKTPCKQYFTLKSFCDKLETLPKIDILINVLPEFPLTELFLKDFSDVQGSLDLIFGVVKAVWKNMRTHKYGRVLTLIPAPTFYSTEGSSIGVISGMAWQGMMNVLKREGAKFRIHVNTLLYSAKHSIHHKDDQTISVALYMIHTTFQESGSIIETSENSIRKIRLQRGSGKLIKNSTPESISSSISEISQTGKFPDYPSAFSESLLKVLFMNVLEKPRI